MKKRFLGLFGIIGLFGLGLINHVESTPVHAEEIVSECVVVIEDTNHGLVSVDKDKGNIGDIVTVEVKPDMFYLIDCVKVNDTVLVESETTKGIYTFTLVEGENKVTVNFVVDSETLGVFAEMFEEAQNKDWENLFSIKNVITIVTFVLNGGLLIAMVRYYVKDKKLENKLEERVGSTMNKIVPETTKSILIEAIGKCITPIVEKLDVKMIDIEKAVTTLAKCTALAQENTPESRKAIIDELTDLKISDQTTLAEIKAIIEETVNKALQVKEESLALVGEIKNANKETIEKEERSEKKEEHTYDGTSI